MNIFSNRHEPEQEDVWTFVAMDPESDEMESEDGFAEAFGGALMGIVLGGFGMEHFAHVLESAGKLGELQDALRAQPSPREVQQAVVQWRASGQSFRPGEVRGVWVRTQLIRSRFNAAFATAMRPRPIPAAQRPAPRPTPPASAPVRYWDRPRLQLRPPRW